MIQSLSYINSALVKLSTQLSNTQTTPQILRKCIHSLVQEVKFLDQKQRYNYYLLISQIYATKFHSIEEATNQLKQFGKTLDSQISMNCELRIAFFHYFQLNYKQAFKHLDLALGEVQEQLKLIDNAKFFFNRVLNRQYLVEQAQDKLNFESGFMLSLMYEHQKEYILALKQIQSFLGFTNDPFVRFQIYKKLLELYECMRTNNISTISVSKKAIQTYKEDLINLQNTYPQFEQNYNYKCKFVSRVINFVKAGESQTNQKLSKKLLDYKLLAYYKLKKCAKQAPSRQIKDALQDTAKLIKASKSTQLLENILNYDFIKQEYQVFKAFTNIVKKFYIIHFFSALYNYEPDDILSMPRKPQLQKSEFQKPTQKSMFKSKQQQQQSVLMTSTSKPIPKQQQTRLFSFNQNQNNSMFKNPKQMVQSKILIQQQQQSKLQMQQTNSQMLDINNFEGSNMYKFNATSSGHEERYFYINLEKIQEKPKLYYALNKKSKSSSDSYYPLKGLKKILVGKQTDTLRRKEAQKYSESQCFALIFQDGKDRSFYVPNQDDLQKWILLLQTKVLYTESNIDKMTKTMGFRPQQSVKNMNRSSPPKKSKKINI